MANPHWTASPAGRRLSSTAQRKPNVLLRAYRPHRAYPQRSTPITTRILPVVVDAAELADQQRKGLWLDGHSGLYGVADALSFMNDVGVALRFPWRTNRYSPPSTRAS